MLLEDVSILDMEIAIWVSRSEPPTVTSSGCRRPRFRKGVVVLSLATLLALLL